MDFLSFYDIRGIFRESGHEETVIQNLLTARL